MTDYKNTINLPKTKFPMKANLANREPHLLKFWRDIDLFNKLRAVRAGKPLFVLHDGPPYANGHIHIGHAVNKTLKDIILKSQSLNGLDVPYVPGWDCHGLPIELNVEKKYGKAGDKISPKVFRQKCREYARQQIDIQREEFKRLGVIGDWENPYITMEHAYEAGIIRALAKIIANGHLHQGRKPVHWCMDCQSSLAEAEVEYKDKSSAAIDVGFSVLDDAAFLDRCEHAPDYSGQHQGPINVPIWTTTPWTLPANQAVCLNAKLEYVLVQAEMDGHHERFLVAHALLTDVMLRYGIEHYHVVANCRGDALEGMKLQHPFYAREVPIVLGDHVTVEAGTGCVHTAPGHGPDDFMLAQQYGLEVENPIGTNGCFLPDTEHFAGEHINKADSHIVEVLKAEGKLIHAAKISHSYPHCWRHKTPIIFRATPQWFISMDQQGLRRQAVDAAFKVSWTPEWGQARMAGMLEGRPDWCISRQRTWGVPLPLFMHKDTGKLHPKTDELMQAVADLVHQKGIEAWYDLEPETLLGEQAAEYTQLMDTLDVWFDSGVSHAAVLASRPELAFPADLYLEGSDQHRGWFQSSLLSAIAMRGEGPYKAVLTHGFTVDSKGRKMSKSIGNVVAPDKVIKNLGADVLRLWVASTDYRAEISVSDEILRRIADAYRRLRNTARYLLANLHDFDPKQHVVAAEKLLTMDRWVVELAAQLQAEIKAAYNAYQFHVIYQKIHHFCTVVLGSFYLDVIKDRQYTTQADSRARRSGQTAMYYIIEALVRWLAPILSFTAEEIWQHLPPSQQGERDESVFLTTWFANFPIFTTQTNMNAAYWEQLLKVRDAVNKELEKARNDQQIGAPLDAEVELYCESKLYRQLALLGDELRFILITSGARLLPLNEAIPDLIITEVPGLQLKVMASSHPKCVRCWHRCADVGTHKDHPELCLRCVSNVADAGEDRHYA